ncbi:MAG: protein involved in ribonucleotide reduction [Candidatus Tokpelaia sp. JSC085]|nr:MAG: protein involved in ribonucleotide reduction [Candidatus Tokpelaia sp. JSC085]
MGFVVYYSSETGNTFDFVRRLGVQAFRIEKQPSPYLLDDPYVLIIPTYADGKGHGAVPKAVIHFLNHVQNRVLIRAVIAGGNRNFGMTYALAGTVVSEKCQVPYLYRFEMRGTNNDVHRVRHLLNQFWEQ